MLLISSAYKPITELANIYMLANSSLGDEPEKLNSEIDNNEL